MPQLDTIIFFNQFFWFFSSFFLLYYFFAYVVIPQLNFYYFIRFNILKTFANLESNFAIEKVNALYNSNYSVETSLFHPPFFRRLQTDNLDYFQNIIKPSTDDLNKSISSFNLRIILIFILTLEHDNVL